MPVQISVRKLREGAKMPMSGSAQAAGYDLYACTGNGITVIAPHTTAMIGTGLAAAVPEGTATVSMRPEPIHHAGTFCFRKGISPWMHTGMTLPFCRNCALQRTTGALHVRGAGCRHTACLVWKSGRNWETAFWRVFPDARWLIIDL